MSEPFLGEIRLMSFSFPPKGWAQCNGQILPISQNQALFSLLGTTYGGDGQTTFALPDLRGRVPVHFDGTQFFQGQQGGEESHTLQITELPTHTHTVAAGSGAASVASPANAYWADSGKAIYASDVDTTMAPGITPSVGGSQSHANLSPYLALNFCIALQGIFPSRN